MRRGVQRRGIHGELEQTASEADYLHQRPAWRRGEPELDRSRRLCIDEARAPISSMSGAGETVDEAALIEVLDHRKYRRRRPDVFATRAVAGGKLAWDLPNVFITPHIGGLFHEYQQVAMP